MANMIDIPLNGPAVNIWKCCKSLLNSVLQSKFGCVAIAFEDNQAMTPTKTPALVPEKRFEALVSRVMVSVHKADLSNFRVDAVVNAANERLKHGGGVALALSNAGGPQIQQDSDNFIRKCGVLRKGEAVAMDAGLLPCKKIIHTVGPTVTPYCTESVAAPVLESAVFNSLKVAEEWRLSSVALPAISSGLFGYPLKECADTIVRTVRAFCENYTVIHLKEILLVNIDDRTVTEMERACRRIFSTDPGSSSAGSKTATTDPKSAPTVQLGTVRLTLKWGQIEEEKTSVIVNTAVKGSWDAGEISHAILMKAGPKMKQALERTSVATRNVIVTPPYDLHCAEVYHTLCTSRGSPNADQVLSYAVSECLQLAATHSHRSIAFPAIGTGGLQFQKEEVAHILSEAVLHFAKTSSEQMEVYFVIYPGDQDTFKAFEEKMRSLQQKPFNPRPTNAVTEQQDDFSGSGASTAKISLSGSSEESMREAHVWLTGILLCPSCVPSVIRIVQNNFITHFGEKEYTQLTKIMRKHNISIEEFLKQGQASIVVTGNSTENVAVAFLEVEEMLCEVQRDFVQEETKMLSDYTNKSLQARRCAVPQLKADFSTAGFLELGLEIVKVERVENSTLRMLFDMKKQQLNCFSTRKMLQRIPAHFCDAVSSIGFQAEFAPPDEPAYGQGIYFTGTVSEAMEMWRQTFSEYLYFVEAEVLTGKSVLGKPDLILPPPLGADPLVRYDSVRGGHNIYVIFSSYQALPVHIITCKKNTL